MAGVLPGMVGGRLTRGPHDRQVSAYLPTRNTARHLSSNTAGHLSRNTANTCRALAC